MATLHYSEPYTVPAGQWRAFADGTRLRLVLGDSDHAIRSAVYADGRLLVTIDTGDAFAFAVDDDVTVRAPRTSFAAIRATADE